MPSWKEMDWRCGVYSIRTTEMDGVWNRDGQDYWQISRCFSEEENSFTASSARGPARCPDLLKCIFLLFFPFFGICSLSIPWSIYMRALVETMDNMDKPFSQTSSDLLVLGTRKEMDAAVIDFVRQLKELSEHHCNEFFNSRIVERTTRLSDQ